ncbi:MAG TPA: porin [Terriglobales bacterium]|nr:porin [Terriglobales bacterium]
MTFSKGAAAGVSRLSRVAESVLVLLMIGFPCSLPVHAQDQAAAASTDAPAKALTSEGLQQRVGELEGEVAELKRIVKELQSNSQAAKASQDPPNVQLTSGVQPQSASLPSEQASLTPQDRKSLDFLRDTTINVTLDGYYEYNFNAPIGRVNLLRAYDVLSNSFSLNQADVIFERAPDVADGRRFGGRLDLQFGQATDTLQGNPSNEPRPDIYRNIFQAYGTYVVPIGRGLNVDFGKFASSIGLEGNYTKDQINYSRSFWFDFLPFYHMGFRASYPLNDKFTLNYWVINGTNQVEPTNSFKDELFGWTATPSKTISWTMNYYLGQEHPDRITVPVTSPIPVQPGLSFAPIDPAPNGRLHIFDSYVSWQSTPKLTLALEGDYVIERLWRNSAPGESSAPSHVDGGAAYVKYQFAPKFAVAGRAEYLSDRGGLFSGLTQALKETTATFDYNVANGFLMRYEWRRDFSNQPSFLTQTEGLLSKQQNTATLGLVWWWGRKEGAW